MHFFLIQRWKNVKTCVFAIIHYVFTDMGVKCVQSQLNAWHSRGNTSGIGLKDGWTINSIDKWRRHTLRNKDNKHMYAKLTLRYNQNSPRQIRLTSFISISPISFLFPTNRSTTRCQVTYYVVYVPVWCCCCSCFVLSASCLCSSKLKSSICSWCMHVKRHEWIKW